MAFFAVIEVLLNFRSLVRFEFAESEVDKLLLLRVL